MAQARFEHVTKCFDEVEAVSDLTLEIADGEFLVLLGPSGSGKSTALRLLAGLESVSSGSIWVGERLANRLAPRERDIAMVFQDYALYPQMTVYENMAFGLRMRKVPKGEIARLVNDAAETLGLGDLLKRRPRELSGGQRQRVALGRALVREPEIFLMDEPLSNLDAALRVQMRGEIKRLQDQLRTTTVYVTHDQVEAMTMGDRVAVLSDGCLQQVGSPDEIYERPANLFVAGFIGSPAMSLASFTVGAGPDGMACLRRDSLALQVDRRRLGAVERGEVVVGVRPEHAKLWGDEKGLCGPFRGRVQFVESLGRETFVGVTTDADMSFTLHAEGRRHLKLGEQLEFGVRTEELYFFDTDSRARIGSYLPRS